MKKTLKKLGALLVAAAMTVALCVPVMADNAKPTKDDVATATVTNVTTSGVTVTAYKIIDANYNDQGFTGYSWESWTGLTQQDLFDASGNLTLTDAEITTLAASTSKPTGIPMTATATAGNYEKTLAAGAYMVLVTGSGTTVYNPMLVSVGYDKGSSGSSNALKAGTVSATDNWTLTSSGAYAKSSTPDITKKITNPTDAGNANGDGKAIDDTVNFEIAGTFPSYSKEYKDPVYKITDTLSEGLTLDQTSVTVKDDLGNTISADNYTLTVAGQVMTIVFKPAYVADNQNLVIKIAYSAKLNSDAGINFDANTNTAKVEYSNDPSDASKLTKIEKKTYTYTFGIDANLNGTNSGKTYEIFKAANGEATKAETGVWSTSNPLAGATFELRKADNTVVATATSAADGTLAMTGLDEGTYSLVETVAPNGYSLDATPHAVVITATYNADGTLNTYSIKIGDKNTSTYSATYAGEDKTITIDRTKEAPSVIQNTKLSNLPSTGGIGTYVFTITGIVIMAVAVALFFMKRKNAAK